MNYYAQAIDIIMDDKLDRALLIKKIAQKHPKVICDAAEFGINHNENIKAIKNEYVRNGRVAAIKLTRKLTGLDFKSSSEYLKSMVDHDTSQ